MRSIAVIASSVTTIVSTFLPLILYYTLPKSLLFSIFGLLLLGAVIIHGVLTHLLNDYADNKSGTDLYSPAILSGGSRIIQTGLVKSEALWLFGKCLIISLVIITVGLIIVGFLKLAFLLAIGLWGAISYSLPPLRFSYRPLTGEWLSTFPSILVLGLAGPWLALDSIPEWAWQNAIINGLFCISWVMVHHIPDRDADKQALPTKQTTVVWSIESFGTNFCRLPALFYFALTALCAFWLGVDRFWAMIGLIILVGTSILLIMTMNIEDHHKVSSHEKILLLLAMINGVWLGIFI